MRRLALVSSGLAAVGLLGLTSSSGAAAGLADSSDPTFGSGGRVVVTALEKARVRDIAVQPDGSVVAVGVQQNTSGSDSDAIVFKLRSNGRLDTTFGVRRLDLGEYEEATSVAVQRDGRIVVAGDTSKNTNGFAWRLTPAGATDTSYGTGGVQLIDSGDQEHVSGVAITADGRTVLAGGTNVGNDQVIVFRLTTAGKPDPTFDGDGAIGFGGSGRDLGYAVRVQGDGKIVIAGSSASIPAGAPVYRLLTNGAPDPSFGNGGTAVVPVQDSHATYDVAAAPNGGTYVVSDSYVHNDWDPVVFRLRSDGTVDPSFGGPDGVGIDLGGDEYLGALASRSDGSVALVGDTSVFHQGVVVGLTRTGARDTRLAPHGTITVPTSQGNLYALAAQPDGKLLIAGDDDRPAFHPVVQRLLGAAKPVLCGGLRATVVGTARADRLVGTPGRDVIAGLGGSDKIFGLRGNDVLCGGAGNDRLTGGPGKDRLIGGAGRDILDGKRERR